jgi:hypothetical protein
MLLMLLLLLPLLQASYMVTSDRHAARAVVEHFKVHRVGVVTCKILGELQGWGRGGAGSAGELTPLASLVEANPAVPGGEGLVRHLLGNW